MLAGGYAITGTVANGTGKLSDYSVTLKNGTLTVNPFALTYQIANDSQTYGTAANLASDLGASISTGVNSQNLGITYSSAGDTSTANVQTGGYAITGTLTNGSGKLTDYSVTLKNGTLTVNPYAFTNQIGNDSQTYGTAANLAKDLAATINTGINSQNLAITYSSTGDTSTANVQSGGYAITATLANGTGLASNYSVTLKSGTLTVNPYAFSYQIANDSQIYGTAANLSKDLGTTINTGVNGQNLDIAYSSSGDTNTAAVGTYPITGSLSNGSGLLSNYSVTLNNGTLIVNPANNNITTTITGTSSGSLYFGQALQISASVTSSSGTPTGSVSVFDSSTNESIGSFNLSNGSGNLTTSSLTPGKQTITLSFQGTGSYLNSSTSLTLTIVDSIYVLNSTASGSLALSGSAAINVPGLVAVDSNSKSGLSASGAPSIKAGAIQIVGGDSLSGSPSFSVTPKTGATNSPDPLAALIANNLPSSSGSGSSINVSGASSLTINPGLYSSIAVSGSGKLTLNAGTYVIAGGGFNVSGAGIVTGTGVTIFNLANSSGQYGSISITGSGNVNLTAPTTGIFAGISLVQPVANTNAISISGAAILNLNGSVLYAAGASINVSGSGQFPSNAVIANELQLSGAAGFNALDGNTTAFTPDQIRTAYGINDLTLDGTGQTIAIVDAYDDPLIGQALDTFDSQFSTTDSSPTLFDQYGPASSFLTVMNQDGQTTNLPAVDPAGPGTSNWELEEELDVEWTHALAPGAQIILVEANSQSLSDLMSAVVTAANQPAVSVVSMSWGFVEGAEVVAQDEAQYDADFTTPAGHQGVTFVASTGDYGAAVPNTQPSRRTWWRWAAPRST